MSRGFFLLAVAALALVLAGCGSSGKSKLKLKYAYPAKATAQFLAACERHSQKSSCECIMHAYQATMPYQVYSQIARGGVRPNNQSYFNAFTAASSSCPQ